MAKPGAQLTPWGRSGSGRAGRRDRFRSPAGPERGVIKRIITSRLRRSRSSTTGRILCCRRSGPGHGGAKVSSPAKQQWRRKTVVDFNQVVGHHATTRRAVWTDVDTIVDVLSDVAAHAPDNHMFFPLSGGLDLRGARRSHEDGCIELETDGSTITVVKPASLQLERFDNDSTGDWTYLRLNVAELTPTEFHQPRHDERDYPDFEEEVTEFEPGVYAERSFIEDPNCPADARIVTRIFRGALVLFAKGSLYNHDPSTYDGRHSLGLIRLHGREGTPELFRAIIEATIDGLADPT